MAQQTPDQGYHHSPNKTTEFHAEKNHQATGEKLEEEHKKKIKELEEEATELRRNLVTKDSQIKKLQKENDAVREKLAKYEKEYMKFNREVDLGSNQLCTNKMCLKEKARYLLLKGDADTRPLEEVYRQKALTREDVQEMLSSQYSSFREDQDKLQRSLLTSFQKLLEDQEARSKEERDCKRKQSDLKEQNALLKQEKAYLEGIIRCELRKMCQEDAETCKRLRAEWQNYREALSRAELNERELTKNIAYFESELERYRAYYIQQINPAAECRRPTCAQKIAELENQLQKETNKLNKRATYHQEVALQEDLNIEYEKLLSNHKVLKVVEGHFKDNFYAKGFLSEIFMDAYTKCKECLKEHVTGNIDELFKLQTEELSIDQLEGVSHAFGLLLQTSGIITHYTATEAVSDVLKKVEENVPQLQLFKKAKHDPADIICKIPLESFVQLAWKFVTQPYPTIVCEPVKSKFDDYMHRTSFEHWDEARDGDRPLIYAQPVVYRSYHGEVLIKGLVGNCV